jgi:zeaxanthin glucosyltransferase
VQELAQEYADRAGLKLDCSNPSAIVSRHAAAIVSQTPREFDLPGIPWPSHFHHAGPFFEAGRDTMAFAWENLDGRPLVYASPGTFVNGLDSIYKAKLSAVGRMPEIQVVLSTGTNIEHADLGPIPANVPSRGQGSLARTAQAFLALHHPCRTQYDSGVPRTRFAHDCYSHCL